ncbi:hypothetical protein ACFE04_001880 [Oxalis oulophora]
MSNSEVNGMLSPRPSSNLGLKSGSVVKNLGAQLGKAKDNASSKQVAESPHAAVDNTPNNNSAPAPKAQVVGWPPIRSFRKNSLATTSKNNDEVDGKAGPGNLFVKVIMDRAPYSYVIS